MNFDVVVIGAGPAGLCFVRSLAGSDLRIAVVERQSQAVLATPADDGREIAITHRSQRLLRELGLWAQLREEEIGTLRDAKVMDGNGRRSLMFRHEESGKPQLGWMVSNYAIRRTAYSEAMRMPDVQLMTEVRATAVRTDEHAAAVMLDTGEILTAQLAVAADNRHSHMRRSMGIWATKHDFGKTMLVLRMQHAAPHEQVAWEWFGHGQTLALLPLHDPHTSSVVVTLAPPQMQALLALDDAALAADMAERFQHRLGAMRVAGPRCAYPLVGVYADRFVAKRFALIGDAAVGMHPLTAHGFNFGLLSVATLERELRAAHTAGEPFWSPAPLERYERIHRRATRPLYLVTEMLASLYTDDRGPALVARKLALSAAARLRPFRRLVMAGLINDHRAFAMPRPPSRWARRSSPADADLLT